MDYVVCLKAAQNDVKALINLEINRKESIAPILELRGKETDKYFDNFLSNWGDSNFFLDFCQTEPSGTQDEWLSNLLLSDNAFKEKREIFTKVMSNHPNMIPVISWQNDDPRRDVIRFALEVEQVSHEFAIRINMVSNQAWEITLFLLDAIEKHNNVTIILDFRDEPIKTNELKKILDKALEIQKYKIKRIVLLSTSFPTTKPPSGQATQVSCTDYSWQREIIKNLESTVIYGDYAATNPFSAVDYIPGMIIIPFACYFSPFEWWMRREGSDKEYKRFRSIAQEIVRLPFFHGAQYCWATKEISRIASLDNSIEGKHGNNGTWNGYKSNQHMCVMLDYLRTPPASFYGTEADSDDDEE